MTYRFNVIETPLGPMSTAVDGSGAVAWVAFGDASIDARLPGIPANADLARDRDATAEVDRQLEEFFRGERQQFEITLAPRGSGFQHQVWALLSAIPFGETRTYGELAKQLGRPNASRAVGRANATNPIAVIVPCHRVIGASGALTGYAGGLSIKERLLALESADRFG